MKTVHSVNLANLPTCEQILKRQRKGKRILKYKEMIVITNLLLDVAVNDDDFPQEWLYYR